jgi:hypothetical protein
VFQVLHKLHAAFARLSHDCLLHPCALPAADRGGSASCSQTTLLSLVASLVQHVVFTHYDALLGVDTAASASSEGARNDSQVADALQVTLKSLPHQLVILVQDLVVNVLAPALISAQAPKPQDETGVCALAIPPGERSLNVTLPHHDVGCAMAALGTYLILVLSRSHQPLLAKSTSSTCSDGLAKPPSPSIDAASVHPCAGAAIDMALHLIAEGVLPHIVRCDCLS